MKHTVPVIIDAHCAKKVTLHNLGTGSSLPKTTFMVKMNGGGSELGKLPKIWDPLFTAATIKAIATSNLIYNLGMGSSLPRNNFTTKIGGGPG